MEHAFPQKYQIHNFESRYNMLCSCGDDEEEQQYLLTYKQKYCTVYCITKIADLIWDPANISMRVGHLVANRSL